MIPVKIFVGVTVGVQRRPYDRDIVEGRHDVLSYAGTTTPYAVNTMGSPRTQVFTWSLCHRNVSAIHHI